jgi:copper chaperone CopZ
MNRLWLTVSGMTCAGCEGQIASALHRLYGVSGVVADHDAGTVMVDYDPSALQEAAIRRRLELAGYQLMDEGETT